MATDATIREWHREQGYEVPARGRLAPAFRERYAEAHPGDIHEQLAVDDAGEQPPVDDAGEQPPAAPAEVVPADTGETPPSSPHRPRLQLLPGGRKKAGGAKGPRVRKRVSLENLGANAWEVLSSIAARGGLTPTARVLGMQAPVAGVVLEDALRGTLVDRVLQPVARMGGQAGAVVSLLAPPVLVSVLTMYPQRAEEIIPMLRGSLRQWALVAGPAIKAREKRERKAAEDLELPEGQTIDGLVESWLETIFATLPGPGVPDAA